MSTAYIKPNAKLISSLVNDKTTIDHQLGAWVLDHPISSLEGNALDVAYSIPTGLANPTLKDICAVHIIDYSGVVLSERTDISYTGEWEFADLIDVMVAALPQCGYMVIIESTRDGEVALNACAVNSTHSLLAINVAFNSLICFTYEDLSSKDYFTIIEDHLEEQTRSGEPLAITLDNGNCYTLKSVTAASRFNQASAFSSSTINPIKNHSKS